MKKRTKFLILIFLIIFLAFFVYGYIKLGTYIDRKWLSFWYKSDLNGHLRHDSMGYQHFPREIPKSAKDVKYADFYGRDGEEFYLKMKMDKDWILKQIKSYKYCEVGTSEKYLFYRYLLKDYANPSDFTYYVIHNDKSNLSFSYYYGLAVNKDCTLIIYYLVDVRGRLWKNELKL